MSEPTQQEMTPENLMTEMSRLRELKGSNLETFAPTFAALGKPVIEALVSCRDHWKTAWTDERETVKRLRRVVYDAHNSDDPAKKPCQCYDCNLMRGLPRELKAPAPTPTDPREEFNPKVYTRMFCGCCGWSDGFLNQIAKDGAEGYCDQCDTDRAFYLQSPSERIANLAAEIAELKAGLELSLDELVWARREPATGRLFCAVCEEFVPDHRPTCLVYKADQIFSGTAPSLIDTLRAELEAARKERDERKADLKMFMEMHDTALAAKDAAEKERDAAREVLRQIATLDCGCVPCTGQCRTGRAAEIELESRMELARAALTPAPTQEPPAGVSPWRPIETAPKDGKIQIMIAEFRNGELIDIDFDAVLEQESESWEMPQTYWVWNSAHGRVENPTHWQPIIPPAGGVTTDDGLFDNIPEFDSSSTEGSAEHVANRCGVTMPVSGSSGNQAPPAVTPSKSPADVPPEGRGELPVVVCLCGSSKYPDEHMRVMMSETLAGRIVIPMGLYGHADFPPGAKAATNDGDETTEVKQMLDTLHHRKIDLADEILVVNVGGYIGSSTKREIAYAESAGKRVRYFMLPTEGSGA